jgi:hypothetical protein
MNEHGLRPGGVAAAALIIGGVVAAALPGHAPNVLRIFIVAMAAVAGLYALSLNVPPSGWLSPFKWLSPFGRRVRLRGVGRGQAEVDIIDSKLSGRRQRLPYGPPMPPGTLRLLRPLIRSAIEIAPDDDVPPPSAGGALSPLSWAILTTEPLDNPFWFQTASPNRREAAEAVHAVLDELERIAADTGHPHLHTDTG